MTVTPLRPTLGRADIERLMAGGDPEERAASAYQICRRIAGGDLDAEEAALAEKVAQLLARDADILIRRTLAVTLRASKRLPEEVAMRLARDVASVSHPVLEHSPCLSAKDLAGLVRELDEDARCCIARRADLQTHPCDALAEHGAAPSVSTMLANASAAITDGAMLQVAGRFDADDSVLGLLAERAYVPAHIVEKLMWSASEQLFDTLVTRHELPAQAAIALVSDAHRAATVDLLDLVDRTQDIERLVAQLGMSGRLTESLVLQAVCMGQMPFTEHALAELSGVPHARVWLMVHDAGPLGLKAVLDRAGFSPSGAATCRAAVSAYHEIELDNCAGGRAGFRRRMIQRVLTHHQAAPREVLDYLLVKLENEPQGQAGISETGEAAAAA